MERVIKFRVWIPRLEMMLYGITLYADGMIGIGIDEFEIALKSKNPNWKLCDETIYFSDDEHFDPVMSILPGEEWVWIEADNCNAMQFTGLHDRNGKEIYEGDIVKTNYGKIGDVVFHIARASYIIHDTAHFNEKLCDSPVEVIGNLYENPELLNQ